MDGNHSRVHLPPCFHIKLSYLSSPCFCPAEPLPILPSEMTQSFWEAPVGRVIGGGMRKLFSVDACGIIDCALELPVIGLMGLDGCSGMRVMP